MSEATALGGRFVKLTSDQPDSSGAQVTSGDAAAPDSISAAAARAAIHATVVANEAPNSGARLDIANLRASRDSLFCPDRPTARLRPTRRRNPGGNRPSLRVDRRAKGRAAGKLGSLSQQIAEKQVEAVENRSAIAKLRAELPILAGIRDIYHRLADAQLANRIDVLSADEPYSDTAYDLATAIEHGGEAVANDASLERQYETQRADHAHGVLQDLAQAEQKLAETDAQYRAAAHDATATILRAPATDTVQQLAIHSEHGVVTPAEQLMVIGPDRRALVVNAMVANRDIGFVRPGQAVKVKVASFSSTRYGLTPGPVLGVSADAIDDTPEDTRDRQPGQNADSQSRQAGSEPDFDCGQGTGYVTRIALDRDTIPVDGHLARLQPGMSVTAEILTGLRRVIGYLLAPSRATPRTQDANDR